jgi:cytoskeletal protein CcmA (bactofilin family)
MSHFDEITCLLYRDGQLDPARTGELVAHADSCAACRALLAALDREAQLLRGSFQEEEEAVPARLLGHSVREPMPWAWIAGMGLAAAGAYTLWTGFVEPLRQQLAQAGFGETNLLTMLFFSGAFWQGWGAMKNIVELMAMATLGIILLTLVGRRWRRRTTLALVVASLAAALLLPGAAQAAETHKGDPNFILPAGDVVKNDLIVSGASVQIDGEVQGDLIVFADSVDVNGHVAGDVLSFARELRIAGQVDGNVRDMSQSLSLDGKVAKNVLAWAEMIRIRAKGQVGGSLTAGAGHVQLAGRVARDFMGFTGDEVISGFIGGDARLYGGRLIIEPGAEIQGKASFRGGRQPQVSPQAKLASPLAVTIVQRGPDYASGRFYWHQTILWGAIFLYGLVLILLMPRFFGRVARGTEQYGAALGLGLVGLIVTPIAAIIACITLVGIAVGISTFLLYIMAIFATQVFVGAWIGEKLLGEGAGTGALIGRMALGLLLIRCVRNLPFIGGWFMLAVILFGLGSLILALYQQSRRQPVAA